MDFIVGFLRAMRHHDAIMVMVDKLRKTTHFLVVKSTHKKSDVSQVFIKYIMILHGFSMKIISARDAKLTSKFWKEFFLDLGKSWSLAQSTIYRQMRKLRGKREC